MSTRLELDLSCVHTDDQQLIKNVCAAMKMARQDLCLKNFNISCTGQVYSVTAAIPSAGVVEINKVDLEAISSVNPLRVTSMAVVCDTTPSQPAVSLKVKVCSVDYPITVTDTHIVEITKKRRWVDC